MENKFIKTKMILGKPVNELINNSDSMYYSVVSSVRESVSNGVHKLVVNSVITPLHTSTRWRINL